MPATNPRDGDGQATLETDDGEYAHVTVADDEVIIYNPDAAEEWIQSTAAIPVGDWD